MITRETTIALAKEAGFSQDWEFAVPPAALQRFADLAVAHSRKDAEPSFYLSETGNLFATRGYAERAQQGQKLIPLYAHPPEADKLLQLIAENKRYRVALNEVLLMIDDDHIERTIRKALGEAK